MNLIRIVYHALGSNPFSRASDKNQLICTVNLRVKRLTVGHVSLNSAFPIRAFVFFETSPNHFHTKKSSKPNTTQWLYWFICSANCIATMYPMMGIPAWKDPKYSQQSRLFICSTLP